MCVCPAIMDSVLFFFVNDEVLVAVLELAQALDLEISENAEEPILTMDYESEDWLLLLIILTANGHLNYIDITEDNVYVIVQ